MKRREALKNAGLIGGAAAFSGSLLTLLQACQSQARLDWEPRFLRTDHAQLVSSLVDTILPATDTPGGLDVNADVFIDLIFDQLYSDEDQRRIVDEMDAFNEECISRFGSDFHDLSADDKKSLLREEEANAPKYAGSVWGTSVGPQEPVGFYRSLKSLAVRAYCTSEEIGRHVLKFDPLPGPYQGCIPFEDVGGVWSL